MFASLMGDKLAAPSAVDAPPAGACRAPSDVALDTASRPGSDTPPAPGAPARSTADTAFASGRATAARTPACGCWRKWR